MPALRQQVSRTTGLETSARRHENIVHKQRYKVPAAQFGYVVKEDAEPKRSSNYQDCVRTSVPATKGRVNFNREKLVHASNVHAPVPNPTRTCFFFR